MKFIKDKWQLFLGFLIAIIGTLVVSNKRQNKTEKKGDKLKSKENKKIKKVSQDKIKKQEKAVKNYSKTFRFSKLNATSLWKYFISLNEYSLSQI